MARFADAPYFMLNDYINLVVAPSDDDVLDSEVVLFWEDVIFTDVVWVSGGGTRIVDASPYTDSTSFYPGYTDAQIFEHDDVQWNAHWDTNPNASYFLEDTTITGVMMRGMEKSIVVSGGQYIDLFAKIDDVDNPLYGQVGFAPVRLKPVYETPREKIYFRFDVVDISILESDPTFTITYDSEDPADEPYYDSDYIEYRTFDYSYDVSAGNQEALVAGTEIYFRKDGAFHEWLKLHANEFYQTQYEVDFIIRNYVNTDKRFLYFGEIYPTAKDNPSDPDRYHIIFNGLKDWVNSAIPANNRTTNLTEWNDTYFDMVHWEGYQLLKDIWSLRDAAECDENYLAYIPTFYGIPLYNNLDENFTPIYREYARDLVSLMKRKGTYASLYIIYDLFSGNSQNIFSVYERWHDVPQPPTWPILHTIPNPYQSIDNYNEYGKAVASSASYSISGAPYRDGGWAYIYDNSTGNLLHSIENPNAYGTVNGDDFGWSVDISETYSIVGAPREDDAGGSSSGKVYIFDNVTGNLLHTLDNPNDYGSASSDQFGRSVAINESYAVVGAYGEDHPDGTFSGKVYVFDNVTGNLLLTIDNPNDYGTANGDYFGYDVDISDSYIIAGAYGEDYDGGIQSGRAYIFDNVTGNLLHTLDDPNAYGTPAGDYFGWSVAITDNYAVVGAYGESDADATLAGESGKAYIFDVATGNLLFTLDNPNAYGTSTLDQFGYAVDLTDEYTVVGARWEESPSGDFSGKVYVYDTTTGELIYTIDNPNYSSGSTSYYSFGESVAISGNYVTVGVPDEETAYGEWTGTAHIFELNESPTVIEDYEDYIYTGRYGRVEPTDEATGTYGYLVSTEEFADPPTNSKPFYVDHNQEVIYATDGVGVIEDNLLLSNGYIITDDFNNVYIDRGATTFTLVEGVPTDDATFESTEFTTIAGTPPTYNGTDMVLSSQGTQIDYNTSIPIVTSSFTASFDVTPTNAQLNATDNFLIRFVDTDSDTTIFYWSLYPGTGQDSIYLYRGGVWAEWTGIDWTGANTYTLELTWDDGTGGRITGYTVYENGIALTPTTDNGVPTTGVFVDNIDIRYENDDLNGTYTVSNQELSWNYENILNSGVDTYGYLYDTITGAYIDATGTQITYDGVNPIFQSMLLLDVFNLPAVDANNDNYIDLYPYVQKVPLVKTLGFPQGAGEFWYSKSDTSTYPDGDPSTDSRMLSPYYRVDLDLNVEPCCFLKILPRNVSENMYLNWEYMRPINRQAEYNLIYAPFTDLTGQEWSLYENPNSGQSVTSTLDNTTFDADNFIYIERNNATIWNIQHNLNTEEVVMYAWDENFTKMTPLIMRVIDENTCQMEFPEGINGLAVVSRATEITMTTIPSEPTTYRILHAFARDEVILQFRFDADEHVYYPDIVRVSDFDDNYAFVEDLQEPTRAFIQRGLTNGDSGLSDTLWYQTGSTWIINVYPEIQNNFFNINCYETATNRRIEPRDIIFEDVADEPQIRIEFDQSVDGWAAITDVGSVISFYGVIPRDANGDMLPVDWRLEVETETDIYTFLEEGSVDADKFSSSTKTIHYGTYITGTTDLEENDDDWWYYTFTVKKESLAQLGIRDYEVTGVELVNTRVNRVDRQRISYSRLSGIWKPFDVNFVGHIRIFKDLDGIDNQLLDSVNAFLYDSENEILTA